LSLKNLYSQKSTKTNNNTLSYDRYSKTISVDNKYYNNYLKTVRNILRLRDDLESDVDLSQFVLYFGEEQVKWEDFYFVLKQYGGILKVVHKRDTERHPICIEGDIYHIRNNNKPLEDDQEPSLFLYGEKIVDGGKEKTIVQLASADQEAKKILVGYIQEGGLDTIDAGELKRARELEAMGFLQITLAVREKINWTAGFAVIK